MLSPMTSLLLRAISTSLSKHKPIRVYVSDIRRAVRTLSSLADEQTVRWLGNDHAAECFGRNWQITLVARADEDTGLLRHLRRVVETRVPYLPVG